MQFLIMLHLPLNYNKDHDTYRIKPCDCQHVSALEVLESNYLPVEPFVNILKQVNKNAICSLKRMSSQEPDISLRTTDMKGSCVCRTTIISKQTC